MKTSWTTNQLIGAVVTTAIIGVVVGAAVTREPAGTDIVLPNSPLYNIAVTESIKGLSGHKDTPAPGTPCPDCGKIHDQPAPNLAPSAGGVSTNYVYCDNCKIYHPAAAQVKLDALVAPTTP